MSRIKGKCPTCGGDLFLEDDVPKCFACSRFIRTNPQKTAYYNANKEAILADVATRGRPTALDSWHITGSTFHNLKKRWDRNGSPPPDPPPAPAGRYVFPELPVFSDSWPEEVQLRWLDTYREILSSSKKEV